MSASYLKFIYSFVCVKIVQIGHDLTEL